MNQQYFTILQILQIFQILHNIAQYCKYCKYCKYCTILQNIANSSGSALQPAPFATQYELLNQQPPPTMLSLGLLVLVILPTQRTLICICHGRNVKDTSGKSRGPCGVLMMRYCFPLSCGGQMSMGGMMNSQIRDTLLCQSRAQLKVVKWCQKR